MKKIIIALCCLVGLALNGAGNALAVSLSLTPAANIAASGDSVTLNLKISGLGANTLGDFDVDIAYDSSRLSLTGFTLGSFLGDIALGEALDFSGGDTGGVINLAELSLLDVDSASGPSFFGPYLEDLQPDTFILASLEFAVSALAPGASTTVTITDINALGDGLGNWVTLDAVNNAVIYNPDGVVPEPTTVWLFMAGVVGLCVAQCRRKS